VRRSFFFTGGKSHIPPNRTETQLSFKSQLVLFLSLFFRSFWSLFRLPPVQRKSVLLMQVSPSPGTFELKDACSSPSPPPRRNPPSHRELPFPTALVIGQRDRVVILRSCVRASLFLFTLPKFENDSVFFPFSLPFAAG